MGFERAKSLTSLHPVTYLVVGSGTLLVLVDLLKKTVFLGASWNYSYPEYTFVYDVPTIIALTVLMAATVVVLPKLLTLDRDRFVLLLLGLGLSFYALSFFALPAKSQFHAMTPDSGLYLAATKVIEDGVLGYFASFHSYGLLTRDPAPKWLEAAATLSAMLDAMGWLPWNDHFAAYAAEIKVQKHGPIAPLMVAPFLYVFGSSVGSAVAGSYAITSTLPIASYAAFRTTFPERLSRIGALFVLVVPSGFIYVRKYPVGYDAITAVLIAVAVALFLQSITDGTRRYLIAAGLVFSLAALSKLTVLPILVAIFVGIVIHRRDVREAVTDLFAFGASSLIVPIVLLFSGYNVLIQYAFTFVNEQIEAEIHDSGSFLVQAPEPNLHNPVLNTLAVLYNARWLGPMILLFAAIFVGYALARRIEFTETQLLGIGFALSLLPFAAVIGVNLARQLLPLIVGLTFVGLCGLELVEERLDRGEFVRLVQASLAITAATMLINL